MIKLITQAVCSIPVPLPNNPLKELNAYLIMGRERNLLIDTGFRAPECRDAVDRGLAEAGVSMDNTDIFLTHLHSDHTGLVPELAAEGSKVFVSREDLLRLRKYAQINGWADSDAAFKQEGFPPALLDELVEKNPARKYAPLPFDGYTPVENGLTLSCGGMELEVIATPGHTPGHLCLYDRGQKLMFLGDHVLFDITPNITSWLGFPNSLKRYLESLALVEGYEVEIPLPAHRGVSASLRERIASIRLHHMARLDEALDIVVNDPGMTAYEIAGYMSWKIRSRNWREFPVAQKWFAVGEAIAHLDYLLEEGRVKRSLTGGVHRYFGTEEP